MWYPATTVTAATEEPVSLVEAKRHVRVDFADDDATLAALIAAARDHVERYCNARFSSDAVEVKCDSFADMRRLPIAPVKAIDAIAYIDTDGVERELSETAYELRAEGLEASVVLSYGEQWPAIQPGSRITVSATVGPDVVPPSVKHAILLRVEDFYEGRGSADESKWSTFDSLLCNHRRGV